MAGKNGSGPDRRYLTDFALTRRRTPERRREDVPVPEWSEDPDEPIFVTVRAMNGVERTWFIDQSFIDDPADPTRRIRNARWFDDHVRDVELLHRCCVRPDGSALFSKAEAREIVTDDDPAPYLRLVAACNRVCLFDNETFAAITRPFFAKTEPPAAAPGSRSPSGAPTSATSSES